MMNYKLLNEKLKDLTKLRRGKPVEKGGNADYGDLYEIHQLEGDLYVRLEIYQDSYGDGDYVTGLSFVSPTEVRVTNFIDAE